MSDKEYPLERGTLCLLCMKQMEEKFISGSYETYYVCECPERKQYCDLMESVDVLRRKAEDNRRRLNRADEIKELEGKLKQLKAQT